MADLKIEDVKDNIDSAYCFVLNSELIQKDKEEFDNLEKEYDETLNWVQNLYDGKQYYFDKLNTIKDLVLNDMENPLAQQIVEVLDD